MAAAAAAERTPRRDTDPYVTARPPVGVDPRVLELPAIEEIAPKPVHVWLHQIRGDPVVHGDDGHSTQELSLALSNPRGSDRRFGGTFGFCYQCLIFTVAPVSTVSVRVVNSSRNHAGSR